jgi:glycosyltransferase involved in cell wall biosynthesis
MRFSVVIPARNSALTLAKTLDALCRAQRRADEIIVVDGCSTDRTAEIAQDFGARVVSNQRQHVAAARQLGTSSAQYEVIAFTDSDCQPAEDWLLRIARHFESDPTLAGVGGSVVLSRPGNRIQEYSARVFEQIMQFPEMATLVTTKGMSGSFAGANCAFSRKTILAAGGFREVFTNHAEEIDLFWRLLDSGARLLFDPEILVEHLEYADTLGRLIATNFNYGIASTKLAKYHMGWQVDLKLQRLLLSSLCQALNPFSSDQWAKLRALQLMLFFVGKIYASLRFRTINL